MNAKYTPVTQPEETTAALIGASLLNRYPILQSHIDAGHITLVGDMIVGKASDGADVLIGSTRNIAAAEAYLTDYSTRESW